MGNGNVLYHAMAIATVGIWGATFVSTKVLINSGLTATEILFYRFVLAYVGILVVSHRRLWASTLRDEFLLMLSGLCGGSLYFMAENTALGITMASNVSLIVCTAPLFTMGLSRLFYGEPLRKNMVWGSLIALTGVGMVALNGSLLMRINPLGDFLTMVAALMWAFYCMILKRLERAYSTLFITRKVFFYGIVSMLVYFCVEPLQIKFHVLALPEVYLNLLFLGVIASMLCYIMWNTAVRGLGTSQTSNYIYLSPLVTLLASALFLSEHLTVVSAVGAVCILCGVYLAQRQGKKNC